MEVGKLTVTTREGFGKGPSRRIRAQGLIPGICYGHAIDTPLAIQLDPKALRASLDPVKRINTVIEVTVEGGEAPRTITAMVRDAQIDALTQQLHHVDLIAVDTDKPVEAEIPLELTGKCVGVVAGGILNVVRRSITVSCKPVDIPVKLEIDVTDLNVGDVIHVSDVSFPDGVEPLVPPKLTIVTCVAPRDDDTAAAAPAEDDIAGMDAADGDKKDEPVGEGAKKDDDKKD